MATRIRSANFSTDADDYIKLTAEGLGEFAKTNFPTTATGATAAGADAIAIGRDANAGHTNSVALGYGAVTNANHQVRLGGTTIQSIRVGNINYSPSDSQDLATKGYVDTTIRDSGFVTGIIDSAYINARASSFDSGNATGLIDSAYIQARQDFSYSSLTSAPNVLDSANVVSLITANDQQRDSSFVTAIIDSAYINARASSFDSDNATGLIDSAYVSARAGGIDSAATLNIVDSSYIGTVVTTTRLPGKTISDLRVNPANLARSHTVDSTDNALLVGPYNVDSGVTLTINGTLMVV